jgi:death on curing protein
MTIEFLTLEDVLQIHEIQLIRFGGGSGLRDVGLLESAIAQPKNSFGGEYLHPTIFNMAAAYLYHITQNHPFIDGNKRTGLASTLVFLELNGVSIEQGTEDLYNLTMGVASSSIEKAQIADELRRLAEPSG